MCVVSVKFLAWREAFQWKDKQVVSKPCKERKRLKEREREKGTGAWKKTPRLTRDRESEIVLSFVFSSLLVGIAKEWDDGTSLFCSRTWRDEMKGRGDSLHLSTREKVLVQRESLLALSLSLVGVRRKEIKQIRWFSLFRLGSLIKAMRHFL